MKPKKVGISLYNAYAYVLLGSLRERVVCKVPSPAVGLSRPSPMVSPGNRGSARSAKLVRDNAESQTQHGLSNSRDCGHLCAVLAQDSCQLST